MDNIVIALSVAIAIVVIMLLSCWDRKADQKPRRVADSHPRRKIIRPVVDNGQKSKYGTGLLNKQANNRYADLANLAEYSDFNSVAQYMSVEPEVYESHARYSTDMGSSTSGPSMLPERDDPNDVVPWVGLRRPKYQDAYAAPDARQEHSEIPDQMPTGNTYIIG